MKKLMTKKKFNVYGMTCASCQAHVSKAVQKLDGVNFVNVNLLKNTMDVEFDESVCSVQKILDAVFSAGYKAEEIGEKQSEIIKKKSNYYFCYCINAYYCWIF